MALENGKENFSNTEASPCVLDVPRDMNSVEHGLVETVCVCERGGHASRNRFQPRS